MSTITCEAADRQGLRPPAFANVTDLDLAAAERVRHALRTT